MRPALPRVEASRHGHWRPQACPGLTCRASSNSSCPRQPAADERAGIDKPPPVRRQKVFVFVRHGHSTWNEQGKIQGNTDESELTPKGAAQALRTKDALSTIHFDSCFASPHKRARQSAELLWRDRLQSLHYLDSLREADLGWFQGRRNDDIARSHPELYRVWREEPHHFCLDGRYPVLEAFDQAARAWSDMLSSPGSSHLVVTHKSLLRAMLAAGLGLPPSKFRALDVDNSAVCIIRASASGAISLSALNLAMHLQHDGVAYRLPLLSSNDQLATGPTHQQPACLD